MKKKLFGCVLASVLMGVMCAPAYADLITPEGYRIVGSAYDDDQFAGPDGWVQIATFWRYRENNRFISSAWKELDGKWYHFDNHGFMQTGFIEDNGVTYYLKDQGDMACNETLVLKNGEFSFDANGAATRLGDSDIGPGSEAGSGAVSSPTQEAWPYKEITPIPAESDKSDEFHALDAVCDSILASITTPDMNKRQKAERIYAYVRGSFTYSGHSRTRDWVHEAYTGLRAHHGDCYTYFAVSQALLTRAGIRCIEVIRNTDNDHFWELVELEDGWWHFDATPRSVGGYYCLWSDAQMDAFSAAHRGCFAFDHSIYPATP